MANGGILGPRQTISNNPNFVGIWNLRDQFKASKLGVWIVSGQSYLPPLGSLSLDMGEDYSPPSADNLVINLV